MPADAVAPKVARPSAGMAPVPLNIELNSIELDSGMGNGISIEFYTKFDQIRPIRCLAGLEPGIGCIGQTSCIIVLELPSSL